MNCELLTVNDTTTCVRCCTVTVSMCVIASMVRMRDFIILNTCAILAVNGNCTKFFTVTCHSVVCYRLIYFNPNAIETPCRCFNCQNSVVFSSSVIFLMLQQMSLRFHFLEWLLLQFVHLPMGMKFQKLKYIH